jgi:hypothetical protein
MILSQITKSKIEKVLGREIRYSSDYDCLAIDIEDKTHEHIGVNTLKRLLGDIQASNEPRLATLDVVANILGSQTGMFIVWNLTKAAIPNSTKSQIHVMLQCLSCIHLLLKKDKKLRFSIYPDRQLILEYIGDDTFKVRKV